MTDRQDLRPASGGRSASAVTSWGIRMARMGPASAIPPKEPALMTVKHYDHTIIDHTDVPTNPLPRHVRIDTSGNRHVRQECNREEHKVGQAACSDD